MALAGGSIVALVLFVAALGLATTVLWVWTLVDVLRRPDGQYAAAGQTKLVWLLVVLFGHIIGSILWLLVARPQLERVAVPRW
jgi:hypothetical protein